MDENKHNQESTTEQIDTSDLPVYDEEYIPTLRHQLSLTMFVRNLETLTDELFGQHLAKLSLMVPEHAIEFPEH